MVVKPQFFTFVLIISLLETIFISQSTAALLFIKLIIKYKGH